MKILTYKQLTDQSQEVIDNVNKCFESYLSDDIVKLNSQAREAEAWYSNCLFLLPQADSYYRKKQRLVLTDLLAEHERLGKKAPNEYDKEIRVDADSAEEKMLKDTLKNLSEAIKQRVSLCQTILKSNTMDRSINE